MNVEQSEIDYTFFDCLRTYYLAKYCSSVLLCLVLETMTAFWMKRDLLSIIFFERGPIIRGPNEGEGDSSM